MSGQRFVIAQTKRFEKAARGLVAATNRLQSAKTRFRVEWAGLLPAERAAVLKSVLGVELDGRDAQQAIDCVNC